MKKLLSLAISVSMIASQSVYAVSVTQALLVGQEFSKGFEAKSVRYGLNKEGGYTMTLLDAEKKSLHSVVFPKPTPKEIADAAPSELYKMSAKEILGSSVTHLKDFPAQATSFFFALGAIAAKDLAFNFERDPVAAETWINGQISIPGQVGFMGFMMANHATSLGLMQSAMANNKVFKKFIPYIGMSMGLTASKVISELITYPGFSQMVKCSKKSGTVAENKKVCDESYMAWNDFHFQRKAGQLVPSIASMMASSAVMAGIWTAGEKAAAMTVNQVAKVIVSKGWTFAFSMNQAGLTVRGIQLSTWLIQAANLAGFIEFNTVFEAPLLKYWNNEIGSLGKDLHALRDSLLGESVLLSHRPDLATVGTLDNPGVVTKMDEFAKNMEAWQQNNAQETLMAHNNWLTMLSTLASTYDVTKAFYSDFVKDVWTLKYGREGLRKDIFMTYPLFGVKLPNGQVATGAEYLKQPENRENQQMQTIENYGPSMQKDISTHLAWFRSLNGVEQQNLTDIISKFNSKDKKQISRGLLLLANVGDPKGLASNESYTKPYIDYLTQVYEMLGKPTPQLFPGQGYLKARELDYADQGKHLPENLRPLGQSTMALLIEKMIYGDNLEPGNSEIIKTVNLELLHLNLSFSIDGFKAKLNFPRITDGSKQDGFYNTQRGLDFLAYRNGIKPSILGDATSGPGIDRWWEFHMEPEYINAWIDYGNKYEKIVDNFLVDLKKDKRPLNYVDVSKGLLSSTEQEIYVYYQILKSLGTKEQQAETVKFGQALKAAMQKVEDIVARIKPKLEQKRLSKLKFQIDSRLSNKEVVELNEALKSIEKEILDLASDLCKDIFATITPDKGDGNVSQGQIQTGDALAKTKKAQERFPGNHLEIAKSASAHILGAFEKMITHVQIVNAVNYQEKYTEGTYQSEACRQVQNNGGTAQAIRQQLGGCVDTKK